MLNSINDTPFCPSIELENVMLPKWLDSISSQEIQILLISSVSIGDTLKFGQDARRDYSGWETQLIFVIEELPHFA
jgi:hypothetical protein